MNSARIPVPNPWPPTLIPLTHPIATAYTRWSLIYDDNINATRDLDAVVLRSAPLNLVGQRVLELGCGTGKNTSWLAEHAQSVVALDFSEGMLTIARQRVRAPNTHFVEHDILTSWPVQDASIDVVVGDLVLEHIEQLAPVFGEAARVLRTGGRLFFCELHPFRQLLGVQARFVDPATTETVLVPAYSHAMSDYVNTAITAGFTLRALGEFAEDGADESAPPRLLSLLFERT